MSPRDRPASRRSVLLGSLGGTLGAGALAASARAMAFSKPSSPGGVGANVPDPVVAASATARAFRGKRQAGIIEPPPAHAAFVALTLPEGASADTLRRVLAVWTDDIERLMAGRPALADQARELSAVTASLTVTVGVGPRAVELSGASAPHWLRPLPAYPIDRLEERWSGGDLFLQVCAGSPTTVAHALRQLTSSVSTLTTVRWVQRGFREPHEGPGVPMRNLFGQVDGTVQPLLDGTDDELLFAGPTSPPWLEGGSGVVIRRIAMDLPVWDGIDRPGREQAIGRRLSDGAPLTAPVGAGPDAPADLTSQDGNGFEVIHAAAHLRRARPEQADERFLRRPYSYDDDSGSGLVFVAYAADPLRQFHPVQQRLAELDLLNLWTTPVGSAVFAVLPGAGAGQILGESLFAQ